MTTALDSDRALENEAKDQFGFVGMAKRLAPSIAKASKGDGMVIGLEGKWGSGKTSLLNFLCTELEAEQEDGVYTITIAPWLNGDSLSLVSSLLEPMAAILKKREEEIGSASDEQAKAAKEKIAEVSKLLGAYVPKTARRVASVAKMAEFIIPGSKATAGAIEMAARMAEEVLPSGPTPSELKQELVHKIQELDISFVVILDDLDRLEPEQAVEVVRLVRSVADFPKVAYLMCYDRDVLAQALKTGLKVEDGDLFLQKIVQLTFNIPLPEPFDLRAQFLNEAKAIYAEEVGELEGEQLKDLRSAVDREGMSLTTPREVKLALNSLRFVFPQVKDDVYFPDFCRLHLIKTTNYKLYKWLEAYLSVCSVLATEDGSVSESEKTTMGKELKVLLPAKGVDSSHSISGLQRFIPSVIDADEPEGRVFRPVYPLGVSESIRLKKLCSPLHYRFYFALTGPKTVMQDEDFNALLQLARSDVDQLSKRFIEEVTRRRHSGKTWFEHVLKRLNDECIAGLDEDQLVGVVLALSEMMDRAMREDDEYRIFSLSLGDSARAVAESSFKKLGELSPDKQAETVQHIAKDGQAINWLIAKFFRKQLFRHGRVGDESASPEDWVISDELLDKAIAILKGRVKQPAIHEKISSLPDIPSYLFGWMNITEDDQAKKWVREYSKSDEIFLKILIHLRTWVMSDKVYHVLREDSVTKFFDWDDVVARLESMEGGELSDQAADILLAISQAKRF